MAYGLIAAVSASEESNVSRSVSKRGVPFGFAGSAGASGSFGPWGGIEDPATVAAASAAWAGGSFTPGFGNALAG